MDGDYAGTMANRSEPLDTEGILELLRAVAEDVIRPRWRSLGQGDVSEKAPGDVVTVADREAEIRLTAELAAAFPNALVVGEEAVSADPDLLTNSHEADHVFYVDPVDGTRQFIAGSPDHASMIGEIRRGEITRAWILQPERGRAYVAEKGAGARTGDGERLVADANRPGDLRGATSVERVLRGEELAAHVNRRGICCGVDYPDLILGLQDFLLYQNPKPWDHVPGTLLVTETGGTVGTEDGEGYRGQPAAALLATRCHENFDDAHRRFMHATIG